MASGPSTAFLNFRAALEQARSLMRLERKFRDPPRAEERPTVEALRGGAVVLMVASFEAFLRDVFEERINELPTRRKRLIFEELPEKMQVTAVFNPLEHAMKGVPRGGPGKRVTRIPDVRFAAQQIVSKTLLGSAFAITGGNADPATVKELFDGVGRTRVLEETRVRFEGSWGAPVHQNFLRDKLRSVVRARNEVAHGASTLPWSRQDVIEAERFLRHLAKTLDDDLRIHLNRVG